MYSMHSKTARRQYMIVSGRFMWDYAGNRSESSATIIFYKVFSNDQARGLLNPTRALENERPRRRCKETVASILLPCEQCLSRAVHQALGDNTTKRDCILSNGIDVDKDVHRRQITGLPNLCLTFLIFLLMLHFHLRLRFSTLIL
jgi:hypothetical protein